MFSEIDYLEHVRFVDAPRRHTKMLPIEMATFFLGLATFFLGLATFFLGMATFFLGF